MVQNGEKNLKNIEKFYHIVKNVRRCMKIIKDRKDRGIFVICLNFKKEPLIIIPDY